MPPYSLIKVFRSGVANDKNDIIAKTLLTTG